MNPDDPARQVHGGSTTGRRSARSLAAAIASAALAVAASGATAPISTLKELGPALSACWRPPVGSAGSELTVSFSLNRTGRVIGKPRITYSKLAGDADQQRSFVAEALGALASCTPVAVTPGLGGAIAGRPLSIRFIGGPNGTAL